MTSGRIAKKLRREVLGQRGPKREKKYSARLTDAEVSKAGKKGGKLILDHQPCIINTGTRATYLKAKKAYKKRRGKG